MSDDYTLYAHMNASEAGYTRAYIRNMISKGEGLPCWNPQSQPVQPPPEIVPGDVGTVDTKGGFRKLFNLWDAEGVIREFLRHDDFKVPFRELMGRDDRRFVGGYALHCGAESTVVPNADGAGW